MDGRGWGTEGDTAAAGAPPHGIGLQLRWCRPGSSSAFWHTLCATRWSAPTISRSIIWGSHSQGATRIQ